jgi:hypothetical protein
VKGGHKFQMKGGPEDDARVRCRVCNGKLVEPQHRTTKIGPRSSEPPIVIDGPQRVLAEAARAVHEVAVPTW